MCGVSVKSRVPTATLGICVEVGNGTVTNEERQYTVALKLDGSSRTTNVGIPWNHRMRPTLVRGVRGRRPQGLLLLAFGID